MSREWIEPKVDWLPTDRFNASDLNRIKSNILWCREEAEKLAFKINELSLPTDKTIPTTYLFADINKIEAAVNQLAIDTYKVDVGTQKTYIANDFVPNADEINRLESGILRIYQLLVGEKQSIEKLSLHLGRKRFGH